MTARKQFVTLLTCGGLLLLAPGCICVSMFRPSTPVLHKPSPCDLGPILTLQLPQRIDTLADFPRTETFSQGGTNLYGGPLPDDIKEHFCLRKGGVEYRFVLFLSDAGAVRWYESELKEHRAFFEKTENGLSGCVYYTEEPRADGEGGRGPMGYYISRADFRLRNLYIRVETTVHTANHEKPQNDKLTNGVKDLGQMLRAALAARNRSSN